MLEISAVTAVSTQVMTLDNLDHEVFKNEKGETLLNMVREPTVWYSTSEWHGRAGVNSRSSPFMCAFS